MSVDQSFLRVEAEDKKMASLLDDSLVTITGMAVSLGGLKISALEKAKTIEKTKEEINKRHLTITKGLEIDWTSVADIGETVVTEAALAAVKLILNYGDKPSEIKTFIVATESPTGSSENIAIQVKKGVNIILDKLRKRYGLTELDEFDPQVSLHVQSACTSQGSAIGSLATNGLEGGKAYVVSTDDAKYKLHDAADATGGFGSVAIRLEKTTPFTKGIRLSRMMGSANADIPDFIKVIFGDKLKESGLELVAKYPIVFGDYSNEAYAYLKYKSLKKFAKESGLSINNINIIKAANWLPHIPYPAIVGKDYVYFLRHVAKYDQELMKRIKKEMNNGKEPSLGGYKHIEEKLNFLIDMGALYFGIVGVPKELKARLAEREGDIKNGRIIDRKLNANKDYLITEMQKAIERIVRRDKPKGNLRSAINDTVNNLEVLKKSKRLKISDLEKAFLPLYEVKKDKKTGEMTPIGVIAKFEDADKHYNSKIRKTEAFKELKRELDTEAIVKLSKRIGNIYTGSQGLGVASYLINSIDPEKKYMIMSYYGSGGESYTLFGKPNNMSEIISKIRANVETELNSQKEILKPQYISIRTNSTKILNKNAPLTHDTTFRHINANKRALFKHLEPYVTAYQKMTNPKVSKVEGNRIEVLVRTGPTPMRNTF